MKRLESLKRISVLWLSFIGLLMQTMVYTYIWLYYYYPIINNFNRGLKFLRNGHILVILIYLVLLLFFNNTYGGMKIGYLKTVDVFLSQVFSLIFVNAITYAQLSLMNNWLVPLNYFAAATLVQILIAGVFTWLGNTFYRRVFPPREILLIHGERDIEDVLRKFETRKDKYKITKCMDIKAGMEELQKEILKGYGAVMLWDIPTMKRNLLL